MTGRRRTEKLSEGIMDSERTRGKRRSQKEPGRRDKGPSGYTVSGKQGAQRERERGMGSDREKESEDKKIKAIQDQLAALWKEGGQEWNCWQSSLRREEQR